MIWSHSPEKTQMHHLVYRWAHCTIRCTIGSVYIQYVAYIYIYIQFAPYGENLDPHFLVQPPLTPNQFLISGAKNWQPILTSGICLGWYGAWCIYLVRVARCIYLGIWCIDAAADATLWCLCDMCQQQSES